MFADFAFGAAFESRKCIVLNKIRGGPGSTPSKCSVIDKFISIPGKGGAAFGVREPLRKQMIS